jgi:TonB family protein
MPSFAAKCLVVITFMTAIQILPLQPTLANPTYHVPPQTNGSASKSKPYNTAVQVLSDPQGVNFGPYLRTVIASVNRNMAGMIPESAKQGETGNVIVKFQIDRNGRVINNSVKVAHSTGKEDMEKACMTAVRNAGPFEPLPEAFHGPYIELRQQFVFNFPNNSR